jgi:hypothetical protein
MHDFLFIRGDCLEDAEERAGAHLRGYFGERFVIVGARGTSPLCL